MKLCNLVSAGVAIACALITTPLKADTPVSSCGTVISTLGDYVLTNDLVCSGGDAIAITTVFTTLRLAGHSISGTCASCGFDGISVNPKGAIKGLHDVRIVGPGRLQGFHAAVHFFGVRSSFVTGLAFSNDFTGIMVDADSAGNRSTENLFAANVATDVGIGFYDVGGQGNEYTGNAASETVSTITGGYGMAILSGGNKIAGNEVSHTYLGILVQNANANQIVGNRLTGNLVWGIIVDGTSSGNIIRLNSVVGNGTDLGGDCTRNRFLLNAFTTASAACIR